MSAHSIDLEMLQEAFDCSSYGMSYYLDRETGEVLLETEDFPLDVVPDEETCSEEEWQAFKQRYILIPRADSRDGYGDMEAFIETVQNPILRGKLEVAIDGSGAFRRFKNVLAGEPERDQWFAFKDQRLRQRALAWLEQEMPSGRPE